MQTTTNPQPAPRGPFVQETPLTDCELAHGAAVRVIDALLALEVEPTVITDAILTAGLGLWGANTGRQTAAKELLRTWVEVRDAH